MGWTWALAICHQVVESAIDDRGLDPLRRLCDTSAHGQLDKSQYLHAQYVDNIVVVGCDKNVVDAAISRAVRALHRHNLITHGEEFGGTEPTALGLHFNNGVVSVESSRRCRIRLAAQEILRLGYASGDVLEKFMGHDTWAALLRREASAPATPSTHSRAPSAAGHSDSGRPSLMNSDGSAGSCRF